jgi:hypothetical protein
MKSTASPLATLTDNGRESCGKEPQPTFEM